LARPPDPATDRTEGLLTERDEEFTNADHAPPTPEQSLPVDETHTDAESESPPTDSPITTYGQNQPAKKTPTPAYAVAPSPPEITNPPDSRTAAAAEDDTRRSV